MADNPLEKRVDIQRLNKESIDQVASDIVRALTQIARDAPDTNAKFHIRFGGSFTRKGGETHLEVIVGEPKPEEPEGPETPPG